MGVLAGSLGRFFVQYQDAITRVLGVVVIVMGLVFLGVFGFAQRTVKPQVRSDLGLIGAPLLGVAMGIGWAPCIGPTYAAILSISLTPGRSVARGRARRRVFAGPRHPVPAARDRVRLGHSLCRIPASAYPRRQHHRGRAARDPRSSHGHRRLDVGHVAAAGGDRQCRTPSLIRSARPITPTASSDIAQPRLGLVGWLRWGWRQLTSMRTALVLLLLLAIAAIPGSIVPQRTADPNGVTQYRTNNPDLFPILDHLQLFDVYSSAWFSAIYILLFISLIGCVIPRTTHHFKALRARPPRTPARLSRLDDYTEAVRVVPRVRMPRPRHPAPSTSRRRSCARPVTAWSGTTRPRRGSGRPSHPCRPSAAMPRDRQPHLPRRARRRADRGRRRRRAHLYGQPSSSRATVSSTRSASATRRSTPAVSSTPRACHRTR